MKSLVASHLLPICHWSAATIDSSDTKLFQEAAAVGPVLLAKHSGDVSVIIIKKHQYIVRFLSRVSNWNPILGQRFEIQQVPSCDAVIGCSIQSSDSLTVSVGL